LRRGRSRKIEQDLLDLDGVGGDERHVCAGVKVDGDVLSDQSTQKSHGGMHQCADIESTGEPLRGG